MTSAANDEWNHYELKMAIHLINKQALYLGRSKTSAGLLDAKSLQYAIEFIEYNMKELELKGGNGDE